MQDISMAFVEHYKRSRKDQESISVHKPINWQGVAQKYNLFLACVGSEIWFNVKPHIPAQIQVSSYS